MGARAPVFKICGLITSASLHILGVVFDVHADVVDWSSFTRTVNDTFSGNNPHSSNNIIVLLLALFTVVLFAVISRFYQAKEKKEILQYEVNREKKRSQLNSSADAKQQRKWFRIRQSLLLKWIPSFKAIYARESQFEKAELIDISGGGLRFQTDSMLKVDDELTFVLDIGDKKPLSLRGRVLRVEEKEAPDRPVFQVAVQFGDLLSGERDRLVSWITKGQREIIHEERIAGSAEIPAESPAGEETSAP